MRITFSENSCCGWIDTLTYHYIQNFAYIVLLLNIIRLKLQNMIALATIIALARVAVAISASTTVKAQTVPTSTTFEILDSVGGSTDPAPGTYTITQGIDSPAILTATPDDGWVFNHWECQGYSPGHYAVIPSETNIMASNPIDVTHDYNTKGYVYIYQAIFVPAGTATVTTGVPLTYVAALAVVLIAVAGIAGFAAFKAEKRRAK